MEKPKWTKPFHGVQHLGRYRDKYSVTVEDYGSHADASFHFPGCGFEPIRSTYDTIEEARAAGEAWLSSHKKENGQRF